MTTIFLISVITFSIKFLLVNGQQQCTSELTFGNACANKTELKWYFDLNLQFCYPYRFLGCNEGLNSFNTQEDCLSTCKPADQFSCGGNTEGNGVCLSMNDNECEKGHVCVNGGTIGFCCNQEIQEKWDLEHSPKCENGKTAELTMWFGNVPLIGRNCSHSFCPSASKCIQMNWTAHCCIPH